LAQNLNDSIGIICTRVIYSFIDPMRNPVSFNSRIVHDIKVLQSSFPASSFNDCRWEIRAAPSRFLRSRIFHPLPPIFPLFYPLV